MGSKNPKLTINSKKNRDSATFNTNPTVARLFSLHNLVLIIRVTLINNELRFCVFPFRQYSAPHSPTKPGFRRGPRLNMRMKSISLDSPEVAASADGAGDVQQFNAVERRRVAGYATAWHKKLMSSQSQGRLMTSPGSLAAETAAPAGSRLTSPQRMRQQCNDIGLLTAALYAYQCSRHRLEKFALADQIAGCTRLDLPRGVFQRSKISKTKKF
jgi:hypothetical protein